VAWIVLAIACNTSEGRDDGAFMPMAGAAATESEGKGDDPAGDDDSTGDGFGSDGGTAVDGDDDSDGPDDDDDDDDSADDDDDDDAPPQMCSLVDVEGACVDVTSCGEGSSAVLGVCDAPASTQCCVPEAPPCSVGAAPGLCLPEGSCPGAFAAESGPCPTIADGVCCHDPSLACDPNAAPLVNEGLEEEPWDPMCPSGMIRSDGFCIDRYEASLVQVDAGGSVVSSWSPYVNPGSTSVRAVSIRGAVPQGYISQIQAGDACEAAGKRLCTDQEWQRACQGAAGTTFPYGNALQPGVCNDARTIHPAIERFGTSDDSVFSMLGDACINQIPASVDTTGENEGCVSEDGAFDMMGNLHEWTSNSGGVFRGGFYVDTSNNGPGCEYDTEAHGVSYSDYSTGFRCCAD